MIFSKCLIIPKWLLNILSPERSDYTALIRVHSNTKMFLHVRGQLAGLPFYTYQTRETEQALYLPDSPGGRYFIWNKIIPEGRRVIPRPSFWWDDYFWDALADPKLTVHIQEMKMLNIKVTKTLNNIKL